MKKIDILIPTISAKIPEEKLIKLGFQQEFIKKWANRPAIECCLASIEKFTPKMNII